MKVFAVGGSVRDEIMGLESKDIDYVVVDSNPTEMLKKGFIQVGSKFPVFLHRKTKQEYALARVEEKSGKGYLGFETQTENISLKQDLFRRDLTINAIAKDENNKYIDFFGGIEDIKNKTLKHVSNHFQDDPVRVLRLARFQTRFTDFKIDDKTKKLVTKMKENNLLSELNQERIYKEIEKSMFEKKPALFFLTLHELKVLDVIFPEINQMIGVVQNTKYHLEDLFTHSLKALNIASKLTENYRKSDDKNIKNRRLRILFSALFHDIGKLETKKRFFNNGKHHGHENKKLIEPLIQNLKIKYRIPNVVINFMLFTSEYHGLYGHFFELNAKTILKMFRNTKNLEDLEDILIIAKCDQNARIVKNIGEPQNENKIFELYEIFRNSTKNLEIPKYIKKQDMPEYITKLQIRKIKNGLNKRKLKNEHKNKNSQLHR